MLADALRVPDGVLHDPAVIDRLNETLRRCRTLFSGRLWRTRERSDWVGAAVAPLCSSPSRFETEGMALAALAFGGWCWREVEGGEKACLREQITIAHRVTVDDASVPRQIVPPTAAWRFLEDGGRPGLGSPGATDADRLAFLDAASVRFYETYGPPDGLTPELGASAFYRGVALNDVERLALHRPPVDT